MKRKNFFCLIVLCIVSLVLSSCARRPEITSIPRKPVYKVPEEPSVLRHDTYHEVAPGETIWRISKTYDVKANSILESNNIKNPNSINAGDILLIPDAYPIKTVIPLFNTNKWKYIIIHHSATDFGNSFFFDKAHHTRGFDRGIGYDFVINNGTKSKKDGQIEVTPRWIKQIDGAHCRASNMNKKGIGIVLVGDFTDTTPSEGQMDSLVRLVNILRQYYNIPTGNIMGHGQVPGAATECPGKLFPWNYFISKMYQETFTNIEKNDGILKVIFVKNPPAR